MRIGLTGGIGSGKSTVARALAQAGAALIDTDALARALTEPGGAALPQIRAQFGDAMMDADGAMDRNRMRAEVFRNSAAKKQLEDILHPMILAQAWTQAAQAEEAAPGRLVVFDVPLLTEAGERWRRRVDRVLVVDCDEATQVRRVMQRSGWTEAAVQAVIAQQASRRARRAIADAVIHNEALSLDALQAQVRQLVSAWQADARAA
ncbi:dephospho-CoA kinase [Pelomonas sp. CA6]|uniref:dephospho-CoA kinase n=1 Tax=Pelomonas sp. CA6 TaxID=2907999 RepID=UPI001F4C072B|nr:dephospho-CoA kinase [Pelomonas sp. CA6]MCH7343317.1 dephospho-CoA kinase [Pelomonas sp. CA6]